MTRHLVLLLLAQTVTIAAAQAAPLAPPAAQLQGTWEVIRPALWIRSDAPDRLSIDERQFSFWARAIREPGDQTTCEVWHATYRVDAKAGTVALSSEGKFGGKALWK